jgi:hypothetical protein
LTSQTHYCRIIRQEQKISIFEFGQNKSLCLVELGFDIPFSDILLSCQALPSDVRREDHLLVSRNLNFSKFFGDLEQLKISEKSAVDNPTSPLTAYNIAITFINRSRIKFTLGTN